MYNDWIEKSKKMPDAAVTLYEATSPEARAARTTDQWRIVTQTGNMFGAGTDADVYVQVGWL